MVRIEQWLVIQQEFIDKQVNRFLNNYRLLKNVQGASGIGSADPASAGLNFQNYNPQSLLILLACT